MLAQIDSRVQGIGPEARLTQLIADHPHESGPSTARVAFQVTAIKRLLFDNERRLAFGKVAKPCATGLVWHAQRNLCLIARHPVRAVADTAKHFRAQAINLRLNAFSGITTGCCVVMWGRWIVKQRATIVERAGHVIKVKEHFLLLT